MGWLRAGHEESPRLASFANGCGVGGRCFERPRRVGEHARPVVVDAFGALEVVRPAVASQLPGCDHAPITVVFLS